MAIMNLASDLWAKALSSPAAGSASAVAAVTAVMYAKWVLRQRVQPGFLPITYDGPRGGPVMFFVHGWPDDETLWEKQIRHFAAKGWRCARVTMPNYAQHPGIHDGRTWRAAGYSPDEVADMLHDALQRAAADAGACAAGAAGARPVLVAHDWGAGYASYTLKKYPAAVSAVVLLDVFITLQGQPSLTQYFTGSGSAGRLGPASLFSLGLKYQYMNIVGFWLRRVPLLGTLVRKAAPFDTLNAFSYWHLHHDWIVGALLQPLRILGIQVMPRWMTRPCEGPFPAAPTLFAWGMAKKGMSFHNPEHEKLEQRGDGSRSIGLDCGHWVMTDEDLSARFATPKKPIPEIMRTTMFKPGKPAELHAAMEEFLRGLCDAGQGAFGSKGPGSYSEAVRQVAV